MEVDEAELQVAVEHHVGAPAVLREVVPVTETFESRVVWDGLVHVFEVGSQTVYAWTSPIEGSARRRFYTVLGAPPINSAIEAVRAAIAA
jgi:hypothetical protein